MYDVYQGQVLAGKYRVDQVLGQGGMGVVVAATHLHLEERVAIKFLLPQALTNPEAVSRFAREARAAVKIKGEHVARVIDVGTLETGAPFLVMEYLDGRDLAAWVRERGALPVAEAVDAVLQACEALAEAHALGIIHRDLKPANLFLTRRPDGTTTVKVLDFGISKVVNPSASDNSMTKTTAVMGSPLYMSPEQMTSSRDVDARSDIWGIGAILYELLTARVPFNAETLPEICGLILTAAPRPVRDFSPGVPEPLQKIVLRCLEKDRAKRFQTVGELAVALTPFGSRATSRSHERISRILGGGPAASGLDVPPSSVAFSSEAPPAPQATVANWGHTQPPSSKRLPLIAGGALLALLLTGGSVFLAMRSKAPEPGMPKAVGAAALPNPSESTPAAMTSSAPNPETKSAAEPAASAASAKPVAKATPSAKSSAKVVAPTKPIKPVAQAAKPPAIATTAAPATTVKKPKSREELLGGRH